MHSPLEPIGCFQHYSHKQEPDENSLLKKISKISLQKLADVVKSMSSLRLSVQNIPSLTLAEVKEPKTQVFICVEPMGGMGDVMAAVNMCKEIDKFYNDLELVIVFSCEDKNYDTYVKLLKDNLPSSAKVVDVQDFKKSLRANSSKVCFGVCTVNERPPFLPIEIPFQGLSEYSSALYYLEKKSFPDARPMGIGHDEVGVFVDQDLRRFSSLHLSPKERIQVLDPSLKSLLEVDDSYHETHKLYFGYSSQNLSQKSFLNTISEFEEKEKSDVDVVLVGNQTTASDLDHIFQESRFSRLEVIDGVNKFVFENSSPLKSGTLRIFFKQKLPHSVFLSCLKASEKLTMLTGDQSFMEGVALDKTIVYEVLLHKRRFLDSLKEFAHTHGLLLVERFFSERSFCPFPAVRSLSPINLEIFDKTALEREFDAFSKAIAEEKDISTYLRSQLESVLGRTM